MKPRSVNQSCVCRSRRYARFVVSYLAISIAIVGIANMASAQIVFQPGVGTSAFTAWGSFDAPANWQTCSALDTSIIRGGASSIEVIGGSIRLTSPAESVPDQDGGVKRIVTATGC